MSLHAKLQQRAAEGRPVRVGLIGAGKFGSMYLAQIPRTPGVHLAAIGGASATSAFQLFAPGSPLSARDSQAAWVCSADLGVPSFHGRSTG